MCGVYDYYNYVYGLYNYSLDLTRPQPLLADTFSITNLSIGPSIRPICTTCCFIMTDMIQLCSNFHRGRSRRRSLRRGRRPPCHLAQSQPLLADTPSVTERGGGERERGRHRERERERREEAGGADVARRDLRRYRFGGGHPATWLDPNRSWWTLSASPI